MAQSKQYPWRTTIGIALVLTVTTLTRADESEIRQHFGEQQFAPEGGFVFTLGQKLRSLVWEHPKLVATVVDDPTIPTRWFNERFEEVETATEPGRYYAYGEAPAPAGPPVRRAMTCCCIANDLSLTDLAEKTIAEKTLAGTADRVDGDQVDKDHRRKEVDDLILRWRMTEEGAVGHPNPKRSAWWNRLLRRIHGSYRRVNGQSGAIRSVGSDL